MNKSSLVKKYFQKSHLLKVSHTEYKKNIDTLFEWLTKNDHVQNDRTSNLLILPPYSSANVIVRQNTIIAGLEEITYLLKAHTRLTFYPHFVDGKIAEKERIIATVSGPTDELLAYERTILNILQRMSGIATQTNTLVQHVQNQLFIAATRKTPWMLLDKKAVAVGGGFTHRLSLSDGILIKDNHILAVLKSKNISSTAKTIEKIMKDIAPKLKNEFIEVEVGSEKEALSVLTALISTNNTFALLFDNFSPSQLKETILRLSDQFDLSSVILEASGAITKDTVREFAKTGVDILSLGSLTHSSKAADLSLDI